LVVVALKIKLLPLITVLNSISSVVLVPSAVDVSVNTVTVPDELTAPNTLPALNPPVVPSCTKYVYSNVLPEDVGIDIILWLPFVVISVSTDCWYNSPYRNVSPETVN